MAAPERPRFYLACFHRRRPAQRSLVFRFYHIRNASMMELFKPSFARFILPIYSFSLEIRYLNLLNNEQFNFWDHQARRGARGESGKDHRSDIGRRFHDPRDEIDPSDAETGRRILRSARG